VLAWIAFVADAGGTATLLLSNVADAVKYTIAGLDAVGLYTIGIWYLARRHEWRTRRRRPHG
jgi:hypothetical protein